MSKSGRGRIVLNLIVLGLVATVAGLAGTELSSRGLTGVGGTTIANYEAHAEVQDRPAPDFTLPALDGNGPISLRSFRGSVVVLNFWGSWCSPCRQEAPGLEATSKTYADRGVHFLGVDERDNNAAGRAFVAEFRITYPSVADPAGSLADDYALLGMPTTFIVDEGGRLRYRFVGYLEAPILRQALDDVLGDGST